MTRYSAADLEHRLPADALALCEQVREMAPLETYRGLASQCRRDPERMAQLVMALAAFVDIDHATTTQLREQVDSIVEARVAAVGRRWTG